MNTLMCPLFCFWQRPVLIFYNQRFSMVKDSSVVAVQIFDQRKFKRRDQGFLGVVNIQVSNHLDLELGGHGMFSRPSPFHA